MALKDAVATVLNRNAFYRDGYRFLIRVILVQALVIIILAVSLVGLIVASDTRQIYFATTSDGRIIPLVPLTDAYRSNAEVVSWAAKVSQDVMRFGYFDYKTRLDESSAHFTPKGWETFNKALEDSGTLDAVSKRKLTVTLTVNAAPEITEEGLLNGVYTWNVRFPISIKFDGIEPPRPINAVLKLRIVRVSTLQVPDGIGIESWIASVGDLGPGGQ
jgi:intracellular multiplication protein IcmL